MDGSGGGGGALGGAVFVVKGGSLTINGSGSSNSGVNPVVAGGTGAQQGSAFGSGFFVQGSELTFGGTGTYTIENDIADQDGSGGALASDRTRRHQRRDLARQGRRGDAYSLGRQRL